MLIHVCKTQGVVRGYKIRVEHYSFLEPFGRLLRVLRLHGGHALSVLLERLVGCAQIEGGDNPGTNQRVLPLSGGFVPCLSA
jgi:hypothetical protein